MVALYMSYKVKDKSPFFGCKDYKLRCCVVENRMASDANNSMSSHINLAIQSSVRGLISGHSSERGITPYLLNAHV
jgi:hypothetical protein